MRLRLLPDPRRGRWRRRLPAVTLLWSVVVALGVAPIGLGALPQAQASVSSAVTKPGPKVWDPNTWTEGPEGSVTVAQTKDLSNQVLQVSWSGFTPTLNTMGESVPVVTKGDKQVLYAVRVYQCRGLDPKITDCYGSTLYNADPAKGFNQVAPPQGTTTPDFPSNMAIAPTGADGSGATSIEVWTATQSPSLGCDATHPCSLVIEPNYGGDTQDPNKARNGAVDCTDHLSDIDGFFNTASDGGLEAYAASWEGNQYAGFQIGEQCAWEKRTVMPLYFAPTAADCENQAAVFKAAGLEMANRAVQQWRAGLCLADSPLSFQYSSSGGEPQARQAFLGGAGLDVALTARPDTATPARPYVYAPLATSGVSVVFVVDDTRTGRQLRDMKLTPRLVAKLLTQSYAPPGLPVASVSGNPSCIFQDPEFKQLNQFPEASGVQWPSSCAPAEFEPTIVGGTTDLVHQLTSWIAADPDATRFLDGEEDPWGMRVNTFYQRGAFSGYPVDAVQPQDFSGPTGASEAARKMRQYEWNPVLGGLTQVFRTIQENRSTCQLWMPDGTGNHPKCDPMARGDRKLFAVMDSAQAKAFSLPEAALKNPAGGFVSPTTNGFQAAVGDMPTDAATGTQQLPYGVADTAFSRDAQAYPLTTVQYAMVPTGGVSGEKAAAIARLLTTVAGSGQVYGVEPGRLAPGFLSLTGAQRQQALDAAKHVELQDGRWPGNQVPPPVPPTGGDGGTTGGTGGATTGGTGGTTDGTGSGAGTGAAGTGGAAPVADGTTAGGSDGGSSSGGTGGTAGTGGLGAESATGGATGGTAGTGGTGAVPASGTPAPAAAKPAASPSAPAGPLAAAPVAAGSPAADRAGTARLLLPVAVIAGLVLLIGGPAALLLGGTPAGERAMAATGRAWARVRRRP
ncbi:hypothetical protein RMN57_20735 [Kitasatospora sp. CM 4170]|uniref:hypothetical protein n=1 Tax=Kitasatospora TaxID=2063 RepID=UPI0028B01584|nr:hypothetical protein [Kitasatospora sp. CM 4170]WNM46952.1 hypothetical protein RMN57_20735 [Kitasatospora sp. CM 4170]